MNSTLTPGPCPEVTQLCPSGLFHGFISKPCPGGLEVRKAESPPLPAEAIRDARKPPEGAQPLGLGPLHSLPCLGCMVTRLNAHSCSQAVLRGVQGGPPALHPLHDPPTAADTHAFPCVYGKRAVLSGILSSVPGGMASRLKRETGMSLRTCLRGSPAGDRGREAAHSPHEACPLLST